MNPPSLNFQEIDLRRMPGFPSGGFHIKDISPGVNIVYGPNGSGKTTLSRAICKLLRPADPPHEEQSLFATLQIDDHQWAINVDHDRIKCQCDGLVADVPMIAPADLQERYVLALHDLISAEDGGDLAAQIVRESAGGFDLKRARQQLKFRDRPRGKSGLNRDLDAAKERAKQAFAAQEDMVRQERELLELCKKRDKASEAKTEVDWIDKALARDDAKIRLNDAQQRLNRFPAGIAKLNGSEASQLKRLRKSLGDLQRTRQDDLDNRDRALKDLAKSILPSGGVQSQVIRELRLKCQRLIQLDTSISTRRQDLSKAKTECDRAQVRLGQKTLPNALDELDAAEIEQLLDFVGRWEQHRNEQQAAAQLREWIGADTEQVDVDALQKGIELLRDWHAAVAGQDRGKSTRSILIIGAATCGILSVAFTFVFHWSWLLLLLATAGLLAWAFVPQKSDEWRNQLQRDFDGLPLDGLPQWTDTAVAERLWQLQQQWSRGAVDREKKSRWEEMSAKLEQLERQRAELDTKRATWISRLGLDDGTVDANTYLIASWIHEFQAAEDRFRGVETAFEEADRQRSRLQSEVIDAFQQYNLPVTDAEQADATVETLDQLREEHADAVTTVRDCETNLPKIEDDIKQVTADISSRFTDVGLDDDDDATLQRWLEQRDDFVDENKNVERAVIELELAESAARERPDLAELTREELLQMHTRFQQLAEQWKTWNDQIIEIDTRIVDAKKRTDLEAALASQQQCEDRLRNQREEDCEAVVGDALAGFLAQLERGAERSQVFHRAAELFVEIAHGRYKLLIEDGDPPALRAFDTDRQVGLSLDELSSGTRLQLLLAARVAFVEQQESQWKLALIFDETLANSDDRRAELIIDAAIKICRNGRQIFYLTAQHEEVGKWQAILSRHQDVPSVLIDLAELRGFSETERFPPMPIQSPAKIEILEPDSDDWHAYGRRLNAPAIDPHREISGIHLWYLIDDVKVLYRLLHHGVNRWGQLQALIEYGRVEWLTKDSVVFRKASAVASVLHRAIQCWRVGRGRPVDREVLIRSGCVTPTFIDAVVNLVEELGGDARALIDALEKARVRGFQTRKRHELMEYLETEGYLDESAVLTADEVLEQVRPVAFDHLDRELIDVRRMEELVCFITQIDENRGTDVPEINGAEETL